MDTLLAPTPTRGPSGVFRLDRYWYVVCASDELKPGRVLARTVLGLPLVLFRGRGGTAGALLDRCPHRNVPLSGGRVVGEHLQCPYHGWEFDPQGACKKVPGLCVEGEPTARSAQTLPVSERDGSVFVWGSLDHPPEGAPFALRALGPGYTTVRRSVVFPGSLHQSIENALDVPHTAFLHRGLFRGAGKTNRITAVLTRSATMVEAEYQGEPRPEGLAGRLLAPGGGTVQHWDRFHMPGIAEVEYRMGDTTHFLVTSFMTPESDFVTRAHAVVCFKLPLPGWLIKPLIMPVAMAVFRQDQRILGAQSETIRRFGGERFISTEIDLLGGQIRRLMRRGEKGRDASDEDLEDYRAEVQLEV